MEGVFMSKMMETLNAKIATERRRSGMLGLALSALAKQNGGRLMIPRNVLGMVAFDGKIAPQVDASGNMIIKVVEDNFNEDYFFWKRCCRFGISYFDVANVKTSGNWKHLFWRIYWRTA
jgi:hypothetical protein